MVGEVDGRGYLSVGQSSVHAGYVQVAAVVRPLAPIGWHEGRHPAAVGVAQGLALLRAVGEQVSACRHGTDRGMENGGGAVKQGEMGKWKYGWKITEIKGMMGKMETKKKKNREKVADI